MAGEENELVVVELVQILGVLQDFVVEVVARPASNKCTR